MKPIIPFALLGALFAVGAASAATTTPVGYSTQALSQGFNTLGLTLHPSAIATGDFELTAGFGSTVTDSDTTFAPVANRLYVLEITDGTAAGTIVEVPSASITGSTITTTTNLEALGVVDGTKYSLRVAPTLEEVFTTTTLANGGVLTGALNIANSDIVWVSNGAGGYDKYFLRSGTPGTFQRVTGATTFTAAPNVPLVYVDGMFIEKKNATPASLTVTGEVKKVGTNTLMVQGFNLLGTVAPAGLTLRTAGFDDDIAKALNVANSDVIWVQQPNLSYAKYYLHSGQGWRDAITNTNLAPATDPALNGVVLLERKPAGSAALDLAVPSFYSSL